MAKQVRVAPGYNQVPMPDGNRYDQGQLIELTDDQYASLPDFILAQIELVSSYSPPYPPINQSFTEQLIASLGANHFVSKDTTAFELAGTAKNYSAPVLVLPTGTPIPPGTPVGTIIVRT